jgi:hypothetical protein
MRKEDRFTLVGIALVLGLAGVLLSLWPAPPAPDLQLSPDVQTVSLQTPNTDFLERYAVQRKVVAQVYRQKLPLLMAAARFEELYARQPNLRDQIERCYPGRSDVERHCRQIISFVRLWMSDQPDADAVAMRLEAELRRHFGPLADETRAG